jgi:peptidoglycan hydrolase-like protein with peptidoglycan-binding domain
MPPDDALSDGVLRRGERGEAVANLQRELTRLGFKVAADGVFGYGTEAALMKFQTAFGLTADGIAGPKTLAKLAG